MAPVRKTLARRPDLAGPTQWFVPFAAMALVAQALGLLDTDSTLRSGLLFVLSACVLIVIAFSVLLTRAAGRKWVAAAAPFAYIVSLTMLILSQQQTSTGLQVAVLVPVLWVAIYGGRVQSALTVAFMLASIFYLGLAHHTGSVVLLRSIVLWGAMGTLLSVAVHSFRRRLGELHAQLSRQATTDPLTGLLNRRGFEEAIVTRRGRRPFVLMSLDVDHLKVVNDTHGHSAGDELLRQIAEKLEEVVRVGDVVSRVGGDEFAVFLADASPSDGRRAARRMLEGVGGIEVEGHRGSVSIGVAGGDHESDPHYVLERADSAMYRVKQHGREPVTERRDRQAMSSSPEI